MIDRDQAFGEAAVGLGLLSAQRLEQALARCRARGAAGPPRTLEQTLLDEGWLTSSARLEVLRALGEDPQAPTLPHPVAAEPVELEPLPAIDRLGPHPVSGWLGAGGMGEVLQVRDLQIGRELAAKLMRHDADPALRGKFVQEAQITGQLEHPGIVPIHELGTSADGRPYFTMKRVAGRSLAEELERLAGEADPGARRRNLLRLLQIFLRVCDAVAFAHARGVIHRDIKPANVMTGEFGEVVVCDWGVAKLLEEQTPARPESSGRLLVTDSDGYRTLSGDVIGTPHYMPPEQAAGRVERVDRRSDVYSLGALLHELLAFVPPFPGDDAAQVVQDVLRGGAATPSQAAPGREVPRELEAVVARAMAYRRRERYQTVEALREDVAAFLDGRVLAAASYTAGQLLLKWASRHRAAVAAAVGVLVAFAAAFVGIGLQLRVARQERREAERQRVLAERRLADFHSLSDVQKLDELARQLVELGPQSWKLPAVERWLARARAIQARAPAHRALVRRLQTGGAQGDAERWQLEVVRRLLARIESFASRIDEIAGWPAQARSWRRRTIDRPRMAWARAAAAVRSSLRYRGLELPPQEGLVPLGSDPHSGLWEFLHLPSGKRPLRGDDLRWVVAEQTGIVLVLLPGGAYRMGCARGELAPNQDPVAVPQEAPVHAVSLAPFFIAKHELTQAQWRRLARDGQNPSYAQPGRAGGVRANLTHPVENVSWDDCRELLARAGLVLPTEAQWEYAARGGTTTPWWTGRDPRSLQGAANLADRALAATGWQGAVEQWLDDGHAGHAPVASLLPNPFGLHHVLGNVWEWCRDPWDEAAYRRPLHGAEGERAAAGESPFRANRGGSWYSSALYCRVSFRSRNTRGYRNASLGVRAARRVVGLGR